MLFKETKANAAKTSANRSQVGSGESQNTAKSPEYLLPATQLVGGRVRLTDTIARRRPGLQEQIVWDRDLPAFGLRIRPSGHRSWIVHLRRRGEQKKITLGSVSRLRASEARARARTLLREAAIEGLPVRNIVPSALRFAVYVEEFWRDYAPHWKPSTQARSRQAIHALLVPYFGGKTLAGIDRQDVLAFRETRAHRGGSFHTDLAVLSAMLGYAEKLGYRQPGSNPCKGIPRYKRPLKERYLSPREYRRLADILRKRAGERPRSVAILWLLLCTGARRNEIECLRWEWLIPSFARLPDSKTGAKRLYLNQPANDLLDAVGRREAGLIFPFDGKTSGLSRDWSRFRRAAAIPDVRLHDLRHSFASVAITDGMALLTLGRLLGHVLPETTARYAHLADAAIQDAASRISASIAMALGTRS